MPLQDQLDEARRRIRAAVVYANMLAVEAGGTERDLELADYSVTHGVMLLLQASPEIRMVQAELSSIERDVIQALTAIRADVLGSPHAPTREQIIELQAIGNHAGAGYVVYGHAREHLELLVARQRAASS